MKQIINELRAQPVIGSVIVLGTAFSIFLIMIVVMIQQARTAPIPDEPRRDRTLYCSFIKYHHPQGWTMGTGLSVNLATELFGGIPETESYTIYSGKWKQPVSAEGAVPFRTLCGTTDAGYWQVFGHRFIAGHPYDTAAVASKAKEAVITAAVAKRLFGSPEGAIGKNISVSRRPFKVVGVVDDITPLATQAFGSVWTPIEPVYNPDEIGGGYRVAVVAQSSDRLQAVRDEVGRRRSAYNTRMAAVEGPELMELETLFTQEQNALVGDESGPPDVEGARRMRWVVFLILLVVPAVNLGSMTQSRLRRRTSEIGVRRAFGASKTRVMLDILAENMVVTLLGGVLGLLFSIGFASLLAPMVFADNSDISASSVVGLSSLLHWSTFGLALLFCLVLNLLSSGLPAWNASRVNPVTAIGGFRK